MKAENLFILNKCQNLVITCTSTNENTELERYIQVSIIVFQVEQSLKKRKEKEGPPTSNYLSNL